MSTCKIIAQRPNSKNTGFYVDALLPVRGGTAVASMYSKYQLEIGSNYEVEFYVYEGKAQLSIGEKKSPAVAKAA